VALVSLALLAATPAPSQEVEDPRMLFGEAVDLAATGLTEDAVDVMEEFLAFDPDHPDALWNLGIWYTEIGRHREALDTWKSYRRVSPWDWRARAKLVQTYQALGEIELRDRERAALMEWYAAADEDDRPEWGMFCREQFRVGDRRVMAFEYFAPAGKRRVFLRFSVLNGEGREESWYSLGSYDATTEIARSTHEIGANDRIYHLDHYAEGQHASLAFFDRMPPYEAIRDAVVREIERTSGPPPTDAPGYSP
jgi:tetratricopeptide (TPR) repeat protein